MRKYSKDAVRLGRHVHQYDTLRENDTERAAAKGLRVDVEFDVEDEPGMAEPFADEPACDISIIIAAYNAQRTLARAIESVLAQTYPLERMELIVVDDCSDDATPEIVRDYVQRNPGTIFAMRTAEQSGSPSEPRNIGLEQAAGDYVFFLDADDWLGEEAVERMLSHARAWQSDLLLVKLRGEGGREVPQSMFQKNQPRVNVFHSKVMWSFGPYKLYRRSLVSGLRFPPYMPEDISFVLRAYVAADIVSVAADYDYYHLSFVDSDEGNISLSTWDDVDSNLDAYADVFGFIGANVAPRDYNDVLLRRLFKRDVCNTLRTIGLETDVEKAQDQLLRLMRIVKPYYHPLLLASLPEADRKLLKAAFG